MSEMAAAAALGAADDERLQEVLDRNRCDAESPLLQAAAHGKLLWAERPLPSLLALEASVRHAAVDELLEQAVHRGAPALRVGRTHGCQRPASAS